MERNQIFFFFFKEWRLSSVPTVLSLVNGDKLTNPWDNTDTFTIYFVSAA